MERTAEDAHSQEKRKTRPEDSKKQVLETPGPVFGFHQSPLPQAPAIQATQPSIWSLLW